MANIPSLPNLTALHLWYNALTNETYHQCYRAITCPVVLPTASLAPGFCALGVFFQLNGCIQGEQLDYDRAVQITGLPREKITYNEVLRHILGLPDDDTDYLTRRLIFLNDTRMLSFPLIALEMRSTFYLLPLFQDLSLTCSCL